MTRFATFTLLIGFMGGLPFLKGEENSKINVKRLDANLYVADVGACVRFWERLGFEKTMQVPDGDNLAFAVLKKGGFELMYGSYASLDKEPSGIRQLLGKDRRRSPAFLYVEVASLDEAIAATKGADVVADVHRTFYGAKEITLKDPGGNLITFAEFPVR